MYSSEVLTKVFGYFLIVAMARALDKAEFGMFGFVLSAAYLGLVLMDYGLSGLFVRDVARERSLEKSYLNSILGIKLFLGVAVLIAMVMAVRFLGYLPVVQSSMAVLGLGMVFLSFSTVFNAVFVVHESRHFEAAAKIFEKLVTVGFGVFLIFKGYGILAVCFAYMLGHLAGLLISGLVVKVKYQDYSPAFDSQKSLALLRKSTPWAIFIILSVLWFRVDTVMLSLMKGDVAVGVYSSVYHMVESLTFISIAYLGTISPLFAAYYKNSKERYRQLYYDSLKFLLLVSLPIFVGVLFLSERFIVLLYTEKYIEGALTLTLLSCGLVFLFLTSLHAHLLVSMQKESLYGWLVLVILLLNIICNLILIPRFSYEGAAATTLFVEIVAVFLTFIYVRRLFRLSRIAAIVFRIVAANIILAGTVFLLRDLNLLLTVSLSFFAYALAVVVFRIVSLNDFARLYWQVRGQGDAKP